MAWKKDRQSWVYFIRAGENGPIKIGTTCSIHDRIEFLQTASWERLRALCVFPAARREEKHIHNLFAENRIRGEWFLPVPEIFAYIASRSDNVADAVNGAYGPCFRCGEESHDRHREGELVRPVCRRCKMQIDGRTDRLREAAMRPRALSPAKPCDHCRRSVRVRRHGLCGACGEFLRRTGSPRPLGLEKPCGVCGAIIRRTRFPTAPRCPRCDVYRRRFGIERPRRLWLRAA
jgi:hypothetical protein